MGGCCLSLSTSASSRPGTGSAGATPAGSSRSSLARKLLPILSGGQLSRRHHRQPRLSSPPTESQRWSKKFIQENIRVKMCVSVMDVLGVDGGLRHFIHSKHY